MFPVSSIFIKLALIGSLLGNELSYDYLYELQPLQGVTICVDAGHGGQNSWCDCYRAKCYTGGTFGACTKQSESDVNLRVSIYLEQYLKSMGAKVVMTRTDDCRVQEDCGKVEELLVRARIAEQNNCDMLVSIHHNSSDNPDVNYTSVFYNVGSSTASAHLAKWVAKETSEQIDVPLVGVSKGDYILLNNSKIPTILVEASFLSNPIEDCKLALFCYDSNGNVFYPHAQKEAYGIARGIALSKLSENHGIAAPVVPDVSQSFYKPKTSPAKRIKSYIKKVVRKDNSRRGKK